MPLLDQEPQKEICQLRGENWHVLKCRPGKYKYNTLNKILRAEKKIKIFIILSYYHIVFF